PGEVPAREGPLPLRHAGAAAPDLDVRRVELVPQIALLVSAGRHEQHPGDLDGGLVDEVLVGHVVGESEPRIPLPPAAVTAVKTVRVPDRLNADGVAA